jgi:hypothetical protein
VVAKDFVKELEDDEHMTNVGNHKKQFSDRLKAIRDKRSSKYKKTISSSMVKSDVH